MIPSAREHQLAAQLRAGEVELGQRRTQVDRLTNRVAVAEARAVQAEALAAIADRRASEWYEAHRRHASEAVKAVSRAEQAEARIAAARGALTNVRATRGVLGNVVADHIEASLDGAATSTAAEASEPSVTLRTIGHWRPACPDCRQLAHPGASCDEAGAERGQWPAVFERASAKFAAELAKNPPVHGLMAIGDAFGARIVTPICTIPGCACEPLGRTDTGPLYEAFAEQRDRIAWALTRPLDLRDQVSAILAPALSRGCTSTFKALRPEPHTVVCGLPIAHPGQHFTADRELTWHEHRPAGVCPGCDRLSHAEARP
jgi:hypothetical protein